MSDEYDRPKKKKKKSQESERSAWQDYKMSPIRFVILFALVVAAAIMGYLLYQKVQREGNAQRPPLPRHPATLRVLSA